MAFLTLDFGSGSAAVASDERTSTEIASGDIGSDASVSEGFAATCFNSGSLKSAGCVAAELVSALASAGLASDEFDSAAMVSDLASSAGVSAAGASALAGAFRRATFSATGAPGDGSA
ncbi:MAG: hypothetical protein NVV83_15080 [Afipia sp.]|nr:hypothetical protein [Afipia sp.]